MSSASHATMNNKSIVSDSIGWIFGVVVFAIGVVNTFWGNDSVFGIFIMLSSFAFFPPATAIVKQLTGIRIPGIAKIVLGVFITWAALGVGELFDKVDLMIKSF
jgi:hypothetical protein